MGKFILYQNYLFIQVPFWQSLFSCVPQLLNSPGNSVFNESFLEDPSGSWESNNHTSKTLVNVTTLQTPSPPQDSMCSEFNVRLGKKKTVQRLKALEMWCHASWLIIRDVSAEFSGSIFRIEIGQEDWTKMFLNLHQHSCCSSTNVILIGQRGTI
jgi:hypothetical protein